MQKQPLNFSIVIREALGISYTLFKIIIPVSILTKILTDHGATKQLGQWLSPVMEVIGLPGDMGLVWATAMVTNLYAGMIVFSGNHYVHKAATSHPKWMVKKYTYDGSNNLIDIQQLEGAWDDRATLDWN